MAPTRPPFAPLGQDARAQGVAKLLPLTGPPESTRADCRMTIEPQARCAERMGFSVRSAATAAVAALLLSLLAAPALAQNMTEADLAKIPAGLQPIKFSHKVHAGDNLIPCQYCHVYARRSKVSGAPSVAMCIGCHKFVNPGLSEVQKVTKYWEQQQPIPWVKIHDIPDFVRYDHSRHVGARNETYPDGIQCQTCHGPIQDMHVVEKFNPIFGTMGWCLECHLQQPGVLEQKRATPMAAGSMKLLNGRHPGGYARPRLTDCLTCHY
jgi:hypothetical protein